MARGVWDVRGGLRRCLAWSVASVKSVTGGHGVFAFSKINNSNSLTKRSISEKVSAHKSGMHNRRAKRLGRFELRIWRNIFPRLPISGFGTERCPFLVADAKPYISARAVENY